MVSAERCRLVDLRVAGSGMPLSGIEDLAIDAAAGVAYLSAYDRRWEGSAATPRPAGGVYRLALDADWDAGVVAVTDLTAGFADDAPFFPHGIDLYRAADGAAVLAVINRRHEARPGAARDVAVELFALDERGLHHQQTLSDPALCRANDLLLLSADRFLVTADHSACAGWRQAVEMALAYPGGRVLLWHEGIFHPATHGLLFANGLALAGDYVLVASTRSDRLVVYNRAAVEGAATPNGRPARPHGEIVLPGGPDNVHWGDDGFLYVALLPAPLRLLLYREEWFGVADVPSRIVRLAPAAGTPPALVFDAAAPPLAGITVAAGHGNRLLAGAAWDRGLMVCRLEPTGTPDLHSD